MTDPQSAEAVRASDRAHGPGLYSGPCLRVSADEATWTDEQLAQFAAEWRRKMRQQGKIRLLTPLPRRVRLRLAFRRAVDKAGIWLVRHHRYRAAVALWHTFGMWRW